jgi:hypothetical protein
VHTLFDANALSVLLCNRSLGCRRIFPAIGPLAGTGLALWDARLVRVEAGFQERCEHPQPRQDRVIELADRDAQAVDLRERRLALRQ